MRHPSTLARAALVTSVLGLATCTAGAPRDPHRLESATAASNLPGIDFARYDLLVDNGEDETVVALAIRT